ncbi:MAG: hypothetical protein NC483_06380 [Ruminococcus sp.]|nr:hypothetical protein [Ruminococcus sp.]
MKKLKIGALVVAIALIVGLLIFASTYEFKDSHLRKDGVRVKVDDYALIVDGCEEESANLAYCKKIIEVDGKKEAIEFELIDFKENGYPKSLTASINGKEFYRLDGLELETKGPADYQVFLNFNVIDNIILFTHTKGTYGRATTLYGIDTSGNIVLEEYEIDEDDMLLKDYTDFITYEDNKINVYASKVINDYYYQDKNICEAKENDIVEAHYTYTYNDGKFTKKETSKTTAKEFIEEKEITCSNG